VQVDKSETCEHVVTLPEGLRTGDVVEVLDTWVDRSYPGSILTSCAFTKVSGVVLRGIGGFAKESTSQVLWERRGVMIGTRPYPHFLRCHRGYVAVLRGRFGFARLSTTDLMSFLHPNRFCV
jgi:hypothetical protein